MAQWWVQRTKSDRFMAICTREKDALDIVAALNSVSDEVDRLRKVLTTIRDVACGERQCKAEAVIALSANKGEE